MRGGFSFRCVFFFFSPHRNLSQRHSAYSFGPSQPDRTRGCSVPQQETFLAEGLSPLTWQVGCKALPWLGAASPAVEPESCCFPPAWSQGRTALHCESIWAYPVCLSWVWQTLLVGSLWEEIFLALCSEFSFVIGMLAAGMGRIYALNSPAAPGAFGSAAGGRELER